MTQVLNFNCQDLFNNAEKELDEIINEVDEHKRFALFSNLTKLAETNSSYQETVNNWLYPQMIRMYGEIPLQFMPKRDMLELELCRRVMNSQKPGVIDKKTHEVLLFIQDLEQREVNPAYFRDYIMAYKKAQIISDDNLIKRATGLIDRIGYYEGDAVMNLVKSKIITKPKSLIKEFQREQKIEEIKSFMELCFFNKKPDPLAYLSDLVIQEEID